MLTNRPKNERTVSHKASEGPATTPADRTMVNEEIVVPSPPRIPVFIGIEDDLRGIQRSSGMMRGTLTVDPLLGVAQACATLRALQVGWCSWV